MPDNTSNFIKIDCIDNLPIPDSAIYNCRTIYNKYGKPMVYDKLNEEMYKTEYHEGLFYTDKIENHDGSYYYIDKSENKVFHVSVDGSNKTHIGKEVIGTILSIALFNRSIVIRTKDDDVVTDWIRIPSGEYIIETEEMKKKSSVTKQDLRYLNLYRRAYLATRTYYYGLPITDSFLTEPKRVYLGDKDPNEYCVYCGGKRNNIIWKGNLANPPFDPKLGWAYFDTTKNQYFVWDGFSWKAKREEEISDRKLDLNLSAPKYKQDCIVEKDFTISQGAYDQIKGEFVPIEMPPEAYGMYTFDEFVDIKNKEEFKDIVNEISKYEDNEKAYEIYKRTYIYSSSENTQYNAGYLQRDYNYKVYLDEKLLEENVDYKFIDVTSDKNDFEIGIYKNKNLIVPGKNHKVRIESHSKTRHKVCLNPNCCVNSAGLNYAKWQWVNDNATIPILDQVHAGYVSKNGFSLDDYSTETFNYKGSLLTLKHRGGGFGFPRTYRFDFEYRFVNREADDLKEPHYFDLYRKVLYNTFKRVIYVVMLNHFNVLRHEEIETALNIIYDLSDEYKMKLIKLTYDFMNIQTRLYEAEEKDDKKTINDIMNPETGDNKLITDRLMEVHDELMLPVEYMCILIVLISYPRHMIVLSDSKGNITSKLTTNNSLYSSNDVSNISISHHNKYPISLSVTIEDVIKRSILSDNNPDDNGGFDGGEIGPGDGGDIGSGEGGFDGGEIVSLSLENNDDIIIDGGDIIKDGLFLYDNFYIVSDDKYHISIYSFLESRWLNADEHPLFDRPTNDLGEGKVLKLLKASVKGNKSLFVVSENEITLFNFDLNEWEQLTTFDYPLTPDLVFFNYDEKIKDISYIEKRNSLLIVSDKKLRFYNLDNFTIDSGLYYDIDENFSIDYDNKNVSHNCYIDNIDKTHLKNIDKVIINNGVADINDIDYITLCDSDGNTQIVKYRKPEYDEFIKYIRDNFCSLEYDSTNEAIISEIIALNYDAIYNEDYSSLEKYGYIAMTIDKYEGGLDVEIDTYDWSEMHGFHLDDTYYNDVCKPIIYRSKNFCDVLFTIKFVDKISNVVYIDNTDDINQNVFILYKNMRIISLDSYMYRLYSLKEPKKIINKQIEFKNNLAIRAVDNHLEIISRYKDSFDKLKTDIIQVIDIHSDLNVPNEFNEINGIEYSNSKILLDVKRYPMLEFKLIKNPDTTDLNRNRYLITELNETTIEEIKVANTFKYNGGNYVSYVTSKKNNKSVYAFYEQNIDAIGSGVIEKDIVKLIDDESDVSTYDEIFVRNSNIKMWSRSVYELGVYRQRELFNSQK